MAILKIRDSNGNVQKILAIKGEDGKDYVLTEADKQEIASMISGGGGGNIDAYTKTEVDNMLENVESDLSATRAYLDKRIDDKTIFREGVFVGEEGHYGELSFAEMKRMTTVVSPEGVIADSVITEDSYGWMELSGANETTYEIAFSGETYINVEVENTTEGTYVQVDGVNLELTGDTVVSADFKGYVEEKIVIHVSGGAAFVMLSPVDFVAQIDEAGKGVFSKDIILKADGERYSLLNLIERIDALERNMPVSGDEESY